MSTIVEVVAGGQVLGAREDQEDNYQITRFCAAVDASEDGLLLVVADGMGGHVGGAMASELVVARFIAYFEKAEGALPERLASSIAAGNEAVAEVIVADPRYSEMGSTLVAALVVGKQLYWLSVGDSLLWLYRDSELVRLNKDHSMRPVLEDLVELGRLDPEELETDPRIHQLRSAIFGEEIAMIDQNAKPFELQDDDWLLLASDGIETLDLDSIREAIEQDKSDNAELLVRDLLDKVETAGWESQDNATVIAYRVAGGDAIKECIDEMEALTQKTEKTDALADSSNAHSLGNIWKKWFGR